MNALRVEAYLRSACSVLNFDVGELWTVRENPGQSPSLHFMQLYTSPLYEDFHNILIRPSHVQDGANDDQEHRFSPIICRGVCDGGQIVWANTKLSNGLIGRNVCNKLVQLNYSVKALIRDKKNSLLEGVDYITADLSDNNFVNQLPEDVDYILHLSQSNKFRDFPKYANDIFSVNVKSTAILLDYARKVGVQKFIYTSSGGVYGNSSKPFNENAPLVKPGKLGFYLGSKASAEILVQSYSEIFQVTIIRPFFVYGPGQKKAMLIPRILDNIANRKSIFIQGKDGISINPIHVKDASSAIIKSMMIDKNSIYNIGGPEILTIREIAEIFAKYLRKKPIFKNVSGENLNLIADIELMKKELIVPTIKLKNSINDVNNFQY